VLVHYLNDNRSVGPFPDAAAATRWLRALPNSLFDTPVELEHARGNGEVMLTALETPDAPGLVPDIDYPPEWEHEWTAPVRVIVPSPVRAG
jgi:hypothetical protein